MSNQTTVDDNKLLKALREALDEKKCQIQECILSWAAYNLPRYPWRLSGKTPYEVFIGEFWLRGTTPAVAVRLYYRFLRRFFSIRDLAETKEYDLIRIVSGFQLREQARQIRVIAQRLLERGKGELPKDSASFARASGLEHHHIYAIMCFGYDQLVAVVDTHVARMLSRVFASTLPSRPPHGLLQAVAQALLPDINLQSYNSAILDLAEVICRQEEPICPQCPVSEVCDYVRI